MNKQDFRTSYIIGLGLLTTFTIIDWRMGAGYLLGAIVSYILYWRNQRFCTNVLKYQLSSKGSVFTNFMGNYGLMALALLLGAIKSEYFNIFTIAMGLLLLKSAVIINVLINRKEHSR